MDQSFFLSYSCWQAWHKFISCTIYFSNRGIGTEGTLIDGREVGFMPKNGSPTVNIVAGEGKGPIDVRTIKREGRERASGRERQSSLIPRISGYSYKNKKGPFQFHSTQKGSLRLIKQVVISLTIFAIALGLNNTDFPLSGGIKSGMRYLLTTETDFSPMFDKVVRAAGQWSNVDWPTLDPTSKGITQPVITKVPVGLGPELPLDGKVKQLYGWILNQDRQIYEFNPGIDIIAQDGEKVKAVGEGTVLKVYTGDNGQGSILLRHDERYMTLYANLCNISVTEGEVVEKGQAIGEVEVKGKEPPRLHFEVLSYGKPIDPLSIMTAY